MSKISKIIIGIVVVVIVILGYKSYSNKKAIAPTETKKETVKIGVILPLTGDLAFMGTGAQKALLLATDEFKDTKYNYEVIFEDNQFDLKKTASAANKLISIDNVDVIMSFGSAGGRVVSPIAEENKVIHFVNGASDQTVAVGEYNFLHWTAPAEEAKALVGELQRREVKKLGIISANQEGVLAIVNAIKEDLKNTDIQTVTDQSYNPGEKDFRSIISKVKNSGAEIYLIEAFSPELEVLVKQMKDAGIKTPMTSVELFEATEQKSLFEGEWYVNAAEALSAFANKYKAKYGIEPSLGTPNEYDMMNMIKFAYENVGTGQKKPSHEDVIKELYKIKDFESSLGKVSINSDGVVISKAVIRMIKDGKPVTISQ